jgi:hypothetical protein
MHQLVNRTDAALRRQRLREAPESSRVMLRFAREMAALARLDRDQDHRAEALYQLRESIARECEKAHAIAEGRARECRE